MAAWFYFTRRRRKAVRVIEREGEQDPQKLPQWNVLGKAADTLSIVAFQAGLFAGMAIYTELIFPPGLPKTTATYWMMMQLAMILGFFTAWPVNAWLIRIGVKERM